MLSATELAAMPSALNEGLPDMARLAREAMRSGGEIGMGSSKPLVGLSKVLLGALVGIAAQVWGGWNQIMTALVILIVLDVVTGFLRAFIQKELSSDISFRKIPRKLLIFCVIAVAAQADALLGLDTWTRNVVAGAYCMSEGLSVLENSAAAGLPVPDVVRQALRQLSAEKFKG